MPGLKGFRVWHLSLEDWITIVLYTVRTHDEPQLFRFTHPSNLEICLRLNLHRSHTAYRQQQRRHAPTPPPHQGVDMTYWKRGQLAQRA